MFKSLPSLVKTLHCHFTFLLDFESDFFPNCYTLHSSAFVYKTPDIVLWVEYEYKILAIKCMMTSLCNETAWTLSPPFYTPKPFLSIFVRVSTLSTIGFLAEARWNLAAMASFRLTSRRGADG